MSATLDSSLLQLSKREGPSRRDFVQWTALFLFAASCKSTQEHKTTLPAISVRPSGKVLSADAWATLEAAAARIIPSSDGNAGAREANVIEYIDRQLQEPTFSPAARVFREAARLFDSWSVHEHAKVFTSLSDTQQDRILTSLSIGAIPVRAFPQKDFFQVFHSLTIEGFLCDPSYGGNRRECGWRTLGIGGSGAHTHHG